MIGYTYDDGNGTAWDENGNTWNYNDARKEFGM